MQKAMIFHTFHKSLSARQVSDRKLKVFNFTISISSFHTVICNEKLKIVKLVVSQKKIHMVFHLRNDQLYDFEFSMQIMVWNGEIQIVKLKTLPGAEEFCETRGKS